jgi:probable phosphoglycerate mutase
MAAGLRLIVVRHGETVGNAEGRFLSRADSPLTARGEGQVRDLTRRLASEGVSALYSSDQPRARKTADAIATACHCPITLDTRLRERNTGVLDGLTETEMKERHPDVLMAHDELGPEYVIPGGESGNQCMQRVGDFLAGLAANNAVATVVAVTHGGILKCILRHMLGFSYHAVGRLRCQPASLSIFHCENGEWIVETWNDTSHLQPASGRRPDEDADMPRG